MTINVWASVGGVTTALPLDTLLGTANQLLGMNPGATGGQWKTITFNNVTGQLANVAGAVGTPSYTFQGDLTTGMYRLAANTIGWTVNGGLAAYLNPTELGLAANLHMISKLIQEDVSNAIVAAATTDLDNATGNYITVTHAGGVVAITSFDGPTIPAGTCVEIKFSIAGGTLTLTHNAVSMILLGGANIILQNGDITRWRKINDASAFWEMVGFQRGSNASVLTTKGDLLVGLGAGITDRLAAPADGSFFVADSTQTTGWRSQAVTGSLVQQAVQKAVTDSNGQNSAITTGAGLRPGLSALAVAMIMAFGDTGAIETFNANVVDILLADLPTSNTSFIYRNRGTTWSSGLVPEQDGVTFNRAKQALLNFEAADGSTGMIDDFGNTWSATANAQIDTAQFKFGTSSLLLDGTADFISSPNFTTLGDGSWEMSCWFRVNAFSAPASTQYLFGAENAGGFGARVSMQNAAGAPKIRLDLSSTGAADDIGTAISVTTTLVVNTWYKVRVVYDPLGGTYRSYLSNNGAAEVQETTTASVARICSVTNMRIGKTAAAGYTDFNGWIDAFRFLPCAIATSTQVPAAVAPTISDAGLLVNFYKIQNGTMYEVTGASVAAGTDPTFTARERLCVAECDTSAVAVIAVRNRALKGQYYGEQAAPLVIQNSYTFNDNIGTKNKTTRGWIECVTADAGWKPGERLPEFTDGNAGTGNNLSGQNTDIAGRNISRFTTHNSLGGPSYTAPFNIQVAPTVANWKMLIFVQRNW